jgi:hypothetical protein
MDGAYAYQVSQRDGANNTSTAVTVNWTRNSASVPPPNVTLPTTLTYTSNENSLLISGSCVTGYTVKLAGAVTAPEVAPGLTQTCVANAFSFTISKSADGNHALVLTQLYQATESSAVNLTWTRDTTPPTTTLVSTPPLTNYRLNAAFTFSANDPTASYECSMDGGTYSSCASGVSYSNLSNSSHTFAVRARDSVGNADLTPATYTWTQLAHQTLALYSMNNTSPLLDRSLYGSSNLSSNSGTTGATGAFLQGINYSAGSSQFSSVATNSALEAGNSQLTIEVFVKFTTLPAKSAQHMLISKMGASGNMGWEMALYRQNNSYKVGFAGSVNGTTLTTVRSNNCTITTTGFHHLVVTFDRGTVKFYCDGGARGGGTIGFAGSATLFSSTAALRLGRTETMDSINTYLNGVLDEVRVSQSIRYNAGFTVPNAAFTAD